MAVYLPQLYQLHGVYHLYTEDYYQPLHVRMLVQCTLDHPTRPQERPCGDQRVVLVRGIGPKDTGYGT